ncbi:MAG: hypothetical protein WDN49_05705 [Acetobacteraceae bacterium]
MNREPYRHAEILIAGHNFGCGSSREPAVWALQEMGIRAIIASASGISSTTTVSRMAFCR